MKITVNNTTSATAIIEVVRITPFCKVIFDNFDKTGVFYVFYCGNRFDFAGYLHPSYNYITKPFSKEKLSLYDVLDEILGAK